MSNTATPQEVNITLDAMKAKFVELGSLDKVIGYYRSAIPVFIPNRPMRPKQPYNPTSAQAMTYARSLEVYFRALEVYDADYDKVVEMEKSQNTIFEEFVKDLSGLNMKVPEQYRLAVYNLAYQKGHSSGYTEVYNYLVDIIAIFE